MVYGLNFKLLFLSCGLPCRFAAPEDDLHVPLRLFQGNDRIFLPVQYPDHMPGKFQAVVLLTVIE
jgi:hypothetical protein